MAFVSSPDAQEVVGLDATNGNVRWRFTASGRVDSSPTIYNGLCIFGSNDGSVYALRARTGERVWQLRPTSNQRIVAYGQVESPWPVAGAVLLSDDTVYFAAGRQPLASGGIYVHAVDPMEGAIKWAERINTVPQQSFYENSGLEFDPVDILHQEGDGIAMSRWQIAQDGSSKTVDKWNGFARLSTGEGAAWVPRGFWSYGPRHQHRFPGEAARRPLCVFQNNTTISYLNGTTQLFRSDFSEDQQFDSKWITGWKLSQDGRKGKKPYRTDRLAENSVWQSDVFGSEEPALGEQRYNRLHAMALAGDDSLYVMHEDGRLKLINAADGSVVKAAMLPAPAWDGLVISDRKLFVSTQDGQLLCLGE
jgi:outer membrane protein assembly factor BamB